MYLSHISHAHKGNYKFSEIILYVDGPLTQTRRSTKFWYITQLTGDVKKKISY